MTKKKLLVAGLCMLIITSCNNNGKDYTTENKQTADTSATTPEMQSFKIRPLLIVVADKSYDGAVSIKEQAT